MAMYNNGYNVPFSYPPSYQQPMAQPIVQNNTGILWVQGEAGAKAYPVQPGHNIILMDSESDCFYIKSTDISGIPSPLRTFRYSEVTPNQQVKQPEINTAQFVTRDEFEELKRMIQERPNQNQRRENRNGEQAFSRNSKQQSNE